MRRGARPNTSATFDPRRPRELVEATDPVAGSLGRMAARVSGKTLVGPAFAHALRCVPQPRPPFRLPTRVPPAAPVSAGPNVDAPNWTAPGNRMAPELDGAALRWPAG